MANDNAYNALTDHSDDARWAYGTGFADPFSEIDRTVPSTVDRSDLANYCLMLGDDALILAQRLSQWSTLAPELEEDVALANIALDLLGQARMLLTRAGEVEGKGRDEDALAYLRDEHEFRNVHLVEIECGPLTGGDFATTIARLLLFSTFKLAQFSALQDSADPVLAAIAHKGVPELAYHRDHAAQWVIRLGDGTEESHTRTRAGLARVWSFMAELFRGHPVEQRLPGIAVDSRDLTAEVDAVLDAVLAKATLHRPETGSESLVDGRGGRDGVHTEAMGYLLAEMQYLHRSMPGAVW